MTLILEYYIFTTNDCNLNCAYCSILLNMENGFFPKEPSYSLTELNEFINVTQIRYNDDIADIIFFGGEPTLNYHFIQDVIKSQKTLSNVPYKFHYMLHTNGLLLQEISDEILDTLDSIMLSVNYDKIPHNGLNVGYFSNITAAIRCIRKKKSLPIVGRFTITEKTSVYSEIALLNPFFDALYWQIENKYLFDNYDKFYASYTYEIDLAFNMWVNYLKKGILIKLIPFMAASYFLMHEQKVDDFCCGYNKSMLYIQTNGQCYTCAEDMTTTQNLIGTINETIQFEDFGIKDTLCYNCPYLRMCLGRCGRMHKEFKPEHILEYCKLNRFLFDLIKKNIAKILYYCKKSNLSLELSDSIFHYTEYTS